MNSTEIKYPELSDSQENKVLFVEKDTCDKYDYLVAVACGAIGGMIDILLVGAPGNSILGKWSDSQVDNAVKSFAKLMDWNPRDTQKDSVASAIGFLEKKFMVNYDQRHTQDVGNLFNMSTKNHHMLSLSHSPDIIGLFFSLLNQFTSTSSFISNGQIITIQTETFELMGSNLISKFFCGIANWLGHIISDIAGSSGTRGSLGRGTGVVIPFYELFQFCKFGKFNVGKDKQDLATIAVRAFQEGYDFRFGLAMSIPVIITDLSIRLIWSIRQRYQYNTPLRNCLPTSKHSDLRIMLILGNGTLCVMDGLDAGLRSGGNFLTLFMRLNLIAWFRFLTLVLKEVLIRVGLTNVLELNIEAYKRVNEAMLYYLNELEKIDIDAFQRETEAYNETIKIFVQAKSDEELTQLLLSTYEKLGFSLPWNNNFDDFMADKSDTLRFE